MNELGFDSLMLVELDQSVGKAFPTLGGLPRELFSKTTTSATIIDHVVGVLESGVTAKAEAPSVSLPVERYAPASSRLRSLRSRSRCTSFERPVLVTKDTHGIADALVAELKTHGITAVSSATRSTDGQFAGVINLADRRRHAATTARASRSLLALSKKLGAEKAELFVTVTRPRRRVRSQGHCTRGARPGRRARLHQGALAGVARRAGEGHRRRRQARRPGRSRSHVVGGRSSPAIATRKSASPRTAAPRVAVKAAPLRRFEEAAQLELHRRRHRRREGPRLQVRQGPRQGARLHHRAHRPLGDERGDLQGRRRR